MRSKRKLVIWIGVALAAAGGLAAAFAPRPLPVDVAQASRGPFKLRRTGVARARVVDRYTVSAPVPGHLGRVTLRAGDSVSAGQELARISAVAAAPMDARTRAELVARTRAAAAAQSEAAMAVERARIAGAQAQRELARARALGKEQALPQARLDEVEAEASTRGRDVRLAELAAQRARREVEVARAALTDASATGPRGGITVRAPAAGRVLRVLAASEGPVAAGTPLVELGDPAALEVVVELPTADAVQVRPGAEVELVRWGGPQPLAGTVRLVEPSAFTKLTALGIEEQRVNVLVDPKLPDPRWAAIGDGYQMDARITVYQQPAALTLPVGALFRHGGDWATFAIEDGRAVRRKLRAGEKGDSTVELLDGVREGETVILYPGDQVNDGQRVVRR